MPKILFEITAGEDDGVLAGNREHVRRLGLPYVAPAAPHARKLAVVGGGPSIANHEDVLRAWSGDIWAVNGAWRWCKDRGIRATFLTVDPTPENCRPDSPDDAALLADCCAPELVSAWAANAQVFTIGPDDIVTGPSTASAAPYLAMFLGYADITFFGCEGSFEASTHAYAKSDHQNDDMKRWAMVVECGGREFATNAQMALQTEFLAAMIRAAPEVLRQRSGGFLAAMVEAGDYDVLKIPRWMRDTLQFRPINEQGQVE